MEIVKIKSEDLKHVFSAKIPSQALQEKVQGRVSELVRELKLPGFRPGKVPASLIENRYGQEILQEVLEKLVTETLQKAFDAENLRPVAQPQITESNIDEKFSVDKDAEFTFEVNVFPEITEIDYSGIELAAPQIRIDAAKVEEFLQKLAEQNRQTEPAKPDHKAVEGDIAVIDFEGFIDDVAFEGGKAENHRLQLGSGHFIAGFEEQLIGCEAGQSLQVRLSFPADYPQADLAGKASRFEVQVRSLEVQTAAVVDDALASALGLENLAALRVRAEEILAKNFQDRSDNVQRILLFDALAEHYDFLLPQVLVDTEFEHLWQSVEHAKEHAELDAHDKGKSDAELRDSYGKMAQRRVKMALLVEEVARLNDLSVSENELSNEGLQRMRQMPAHMQQAYFQQVKSNPKILEELRLPLLEQKVVRHILSRTNLKPITMSEEEFDAFEAKIGDEQASDEQASDAKPKQQSQAKPTKSTKSIGATKEKQNKTKG